jgi:LmbE family N-acetylglucosaminyl deacetylase
MRHTCRTGRLVVLALTALCAVVAGGACDRAQPERPPDAERIPDALSVSVVADTRLVVFAPHPDDEVLAAGGLIQHVREAGGTVRVVYITSGDSYTDSVKLEQHVGTPKGANYRAYGHQREFEARAAMRILGVGAWSLTFLGFPNDGLTRLMSTYWSERHAAYRSPYTRQRRPAQSDTFIPDTEYRGEDLTQELAEIIGDFKPTIILVPRPEDQHPDHCATWFFVADALGDVLRVQPRLRTDLVNYIVHYNSWAVEDQDPFLKPPEDLDGGTGWLTVPLTDREVDGKRAAVHAYQSQMAAIGWFLDGFVRHNEVFSRPPLPHISLPITHSVCEDFEPPPSGTHKK